MQYTLKRITTEPGSVLQVLVDRPQGDGDGGFLLGGSFRFAPAGQDGDTAAVSEHAARIIMGDPGLAIHFECQPPLAAPGEVNAVRKGPYRGPEKK